VVPHTHNVRGELGGIERQKTERITGSGIFRAETGGRTRSFVADIRGRGGWPALWGLKKEKKGRLPPRRK